MSNVPAESFGRDHASLLLYLETRVVDHEGRVDVQHLRKRGPARLRGGMETESDHSDRECLEDLEAAGLVENNGTGLQPIVKLTDRGWIAAHRLRRMRADGIPNSWETEWWVDVKPSAKEAKADG